MTSTSFVLFGFLIIFLSMQAFFLYQVQQLPISGINRFGLPLGSKQDSIPCKEESKEVVPSTHKTVNRYLTLPPWPSRIEDVWKQGKIVRNPQFLLDFAIIGTEKSGTSTLMKWFGAHEQVKCFQEEIYDLYDQAPDRLMKRMIEKMPPGDHFKRGYKSPIDIFNLQVFYQLDKFWPEAKLIVTLRHPVLQFQSLFNFRIQNLNSINKTLAFYDPATDAAFDTKCTQDGEGVCTDRSYFGQYLYRFGKTLGLPNHPTQTEKLILADLKRDHPFSVPKIQYFRNKMFLIDLFNQTHTH